MSIDKKTAPKSQTQISKHWGYFLWAVPIIAIIGVSMLFYGMWLNFSTDGYYVLADIPIDSNILIIGGLVVAFIIVAGFFGILGRVIIKRGDLFLRIKNIRIKKLFKFGLATFSILLMLAGAGVFVWGALEIPYRNYTSGPYLSWANGQEPSNSITVCWRSSTATPSQVRYGTSIDALSNSIDANLKGVSHFVTLSNLNPNTEYFYEVIGQNFGIKSFRTAPASGQAVNFTFCIWSDPRTNSGYESAITRPNLVEYMSKNLAQSNTDLAFSIVTGDITSYGGNYKTWMLYLQDITTNDFASNASNIDAIGNHEHHSDPELRNFKQYYPYQQCNFSVVYGQVYVLVLDTFDYENEEWVGVKFPQAQFEWAKADLAAHASVPFKIISLHQSPIRDGNFTTGGHHGNISTELLYLCNNYGVDALFCGHTHQYEVEKLNKTHYIMQGMGGNPNSDGWEYTGQDSDVISAGGQILATGDNYPGWMRVDMTPNQMHIRPLLINGTELSGFTINASDNP